jgi:hypothetical protein
VNPLKDIKTSAMIVFVVVLLGTFFLAALSYHLLVPTTPTLTAATSTAPVATTPPVVATTTSTANYPPPVPPASVLGISADTQTAFESIPWVRLGYYTCGTNNVQGDVLKKTVESYHRQGVRVLLSVCQWATDTRLFDTKILNDAAQGGSDAVQCGNEEMKSGAFNRYITPQNFARFFNLCEQAMHAVRPEIPIILGALDPHVGGIDYQPLLDQVKYLNDMQTAMNTSVHPGGNWSWRSQTVGLIDSWHNGYPSQSVNSLYWLFVFWAQQFGVNLNSGDLGKHLWVIEGTGCVRGCGINADNPSDIAVSHILTLITDVETTLRYKVPFFYFSAKDFFIGSVSWPMGVRDIRGLAKPLRQDLPMGARTLSMSCPTGKVTVVNQEQLLSKLYGGCTLPANYIDILTS